MINTEGYIYFGIKTENENFDLNFFNKYLTISPTSFRKKFEKGNTPICTCWEISSENMVNPIYFEELDKLILKLNPHKNELLKIKSEYPEMQFTLEVVIYLGDETPGLSFSKETLKFINDVGAIIDCDIYNIK